MTPRQFALFAAGLVLPTLYQRLKFALNRRSFYRTELRRKSGLNIHHGHWGLVLAAVSTWMLVFGLRDYISIGLAGLGWGLMLDEIIPMLRMPSKDRDLELKVYGDSGRATAILIITTVLASSVLFLLLG
ncbi:MAG: hypothetical protein KGI49_02585 [Patescibacteria group bacterium]|nr:hypothetical protein [Patescibacteria group bacterium]